MIVSWNDSSSTSPASSPELLARIRGEFREMPGLRLTISQACRLWQVDVTTCEAVLHALLAEGFLAQTSNGMFVAMSVPTGATARSLNGALERQGVMALARRSA
jgi:hypothetical protein